MTTKTINWTIKPFSELTTLEFFRLEELRFEVFVTEQKITDPELDETDLTAWHIFGTNENGVVVAVARFFIEDGNLLIGRVVVKENARRLHLGSQMMKEIENYVKKHNLASEITLHAQLYIKDFYQSLGYQQIGPVFDEAGIDHITMVKQL